MWKLLKYEFRRARTSFHTPILYGCGPKICLQSLHPVKHPFVATIFQKGRKLDISIL